MSERTSVTTDVAGRRVVAKVAEDEAQATLLAHEAAVLDAARHPGVVELIGVDGHGPGAMLLTAAVDGPSLAEVGALPVEEAAGILAALATTLADLHDLGVVHGALSPEHVVLGADGRPVLCGLAYGGRSGEPALAPPSVPAAFVDPSARPGAPLEPAGDVFGLAMLARHLVPAPPVGHAVAGVAALAAVDPPDRPPARQVARDLQQRVPAARLPRALAAGSQGGEGPPAPPHADPLEAWRRRGDGGARRRALGPTGRRAAVAVGAALAIGAAAVGVVALSRPEVAPDRSDPYDLEVPGPPPAPSGEAAPGPATTRPGAALPPTSTPPPPAPRAGCPAVASVLQADVDGDGCPEPVRYVDGILEAGGASWALGRVGDQVATGDWGCQGSRTVALFRPATGELFRFDAWAPEGRDLRATPVATIDGGRLLRAADLDRDGCHEAVVERASGLPVEVVRLPPAAR